ncbi:MAG: hypothetical protein IKC51_01965 [Myxococcaceae bacterium]|nr:hypothetical protein [Myxococcaceae bacterium]
MKRRVSTGAQRPKMRLSALLIVFALERTPLFFLCFGARHFKNASARGSLKTLERWADFVLI